MGVSPTLPSGTGLSDAASPTRLTLVSALIVDMGGMGEGILNACCGNLNLPSRCQDSKGGLQHGGWTHSSKGIGGSMQVLWNTWGPMGQ